MSRKRTAIIGLLVLMLVLLSYLFVSSQNRSVTYLSYTVTHSLKHVTLDEVDDAMVPFLAQSFWEVDLVGLKQALEQINWVHAATIKRSWPGYLNIALEEHVPIARWGDDALISQYGEIFQPTSMQEFELLVRLEGDRLQSASLLNNWRKIDQQLNPLGWQVLGLTQQVDGVFRVKLNVGKELLFDTPNRVDKLQRFVQAYPQLSKKLVESAVGFDLRYSNGVAIKLASSQSN